MRQLSNKYLQWTKAFVVEYLLCEKAHDTSRATIEGSPPNATPLFGHVESLSLNW